MKNEILNACYQLLAAAVNGTYQGILITVLVAASLGMLRRTNAATRYAVWFGTLLLLALIIPAHFLRSRWDADVTPATVATSVSSPAIQTEQDSVRLDASQLTRDANAESRSFAVESDFPQNNREPDANRTTAQKELEFATSAAINGQALEDVVRPFYPAIPCATAPNQVELSAAHESGFIAGIKQKLTWLGNRLVTPFPSWNIVPKAPLYVAALLPICWLAIAGAKVSLLIGQLFRIRSLKLNSVEPGPDMNALFLSLRKRIGVRRNVALRVSIDHKSPVVLGFFEPAILLPASAGLEASEHILRHELAHVGRRDDWANLVQHFIKALFFFHPAIWWVSKRISLEREIACDDQVLQSTLRPKAYALLLADLAGRMQAPVLAPGVSTNQSQLKQRIDMILNTKRNTSPRLAKTRLGLLATASALLAVAAVYAAPRLAFAQSKDAPAPAFAPPADAPIAEIAGAGPVTIIAVEPVDAPTAPPPPGAPSALPAVPPVPAGPKFKPGSTVTVAVPAPGAPRAPVTILTVPSPALAPVAPGAAVAILTAPSPAIPPVAAVPALTAPVPVGPLVATAEPYPMSDLPALPRPARRAVKDASIEERLDRLEKMVESLVSQQKKNTSHFEYTLKSPPGEMSFDRKSYPEHMAKKQAEYELKRDDMEKQVKELKELEKQRKLSDPEVSEKVKKLAEQHARMAADHEKIAREAEQAAREAQRAARDSQRETVHKMREGSHQELEALRRQHEALEREMQKLDRQIEKMERDQELLEERQENDELDQDVKLSRNNSCDDQPSDPSNNKNISLPQPAAR